MGETRVTGYGRLRSVASLLADLDDQLEHGTATALVPVATGFRPLDRILGGGLHPGALTIVGGAPGVGKTILALQWARHIARDGRHVAYVCYEHEEFELLLRLVVMEAGELAPELAETVGDDLATSAATAGSSLLDVLSRSGVGQEVLAALGAYADRLHLVRASGAHTGIAELAAMVRELADEPVALFVDYLQKVPVVPEPANEAEKVTLVTEALKDLALTEQVPVVAIAAVEMAGLKTRRVRMHHFRGSSALVFEADVALVVNEKANAVSKVHLAYDPVRASSFHDWVVLTVEKNRGGPNLVDLEYRKDFARFRFEPDGAIVTDQLVDERLDDDG